MAVARPQPAGMLRALVHINLHESCMSATARVLIATAALVALLSGCASPVRTEPVSFTPLATQPAQVVQLRQEATATLATGYPRTLKAGSQWRLAGSVAQGQVYRPVNTVFTIEGRHVHEAYLVVSSGKLLGFYLPGEAQYAALETPVPLSFGDLQ